MDEFAEGRNLQQWAMKMGFVPGGKFVSSENFPSAEAFQKLFKGKSAKLWTEIMNKVKPKQEVLHIQKNLLLKQLKAGIPVGQNTVSGKLCEQLRLDAKIQAKEKERDELLESIHHKEIAMLSQEKALRKSAHKSVELQHQIDEFKKKQLLFKMKSNECRSTISWYKDVTAVVSDLCPPPPNMKPPQANADSAAIVLLKCIDAIRDFHAISFGGGSGLLEDPEHDERRDALLKHLWEEIVKNTNGWGAQLIWDSLTSNLMPGLLDEVSDSIASSSGSRDDPDIRSDESHAQMGNATAILPAIYVTWMTENMNLKIKANIKAAELEKFEKRCFAEIEAQIAVENLNTSKRSINSAEVIKLWLELQAKKAGLTAKLHEIKIEISKIRQNAPSILSASSHLKASKEELTTLNFQIDEKKRKVQENISQMNAVGCRLKTALAKVLQQRGSFNSQLPVFLQVLKQDRFVSDGDCYSPQRKGPLSSTMIGNVTADTSLSFDTTASVCDFAAEKCGSFSNLSEIVSILREAIPKEAKLFSKLHLDTVPFVCLNGNWKEPLCNLVVQGPVLMYRSPGILQKHFLQTIRGTPFASAPDIIMNQFYAQNHIRALRKLKILKRAQPLADLESPSYLANMDDLKSKQEAALQTQIDEVDLTTDDIDSLLCTSKESMEAWLERPVQNAVLPTLTVNGLKFSDWCKHYEKKQGGN